MPRKIRSYREEYDTYHGKPEQIANRSARNTARGKKGLKKGDKREVDHKVPLSKGGSVSMKNVRVVKSSINRRKYNK